MGIPLTRAIYEENRETIVHGLFRLAEEVAPSRQRGQYHHAVAGGSFGLKLFQACFESITHPLSRGGTDLIPLDVLTDY